MYDMLYNSHLRLRKRLVLLTKAYKYESAKLAHSKRELLKIVKRDFLLLKQQQKR